LSIPPVSEAHLQNLCLIPQYFCYRFRDVSEHSFWVEREQASSIPPSSDVPAGQRAIPRTAVEIREVLFADYIYTASVQPLNLLTIRSLQGRKRANVAQL
jgi:hypothetical protein